MKFRSLLLLTFVSVARLAATPLGIGSQYDVVVKNNFTSDSGHMHGSSAVGGNLVLTGGMSEFGNDLNAASGPGVVVGGNVVLGASGRVNGSRQAHIGALTGGQTTTNQGLFGGGQMLEATSGVTVGPVGINFGAAFDEFTLLSQAMADLASTVVLSQVTSGDTQNKQLNLEFGAADKVLNLTYAEFVSFKNIQVGNPGAGVGSWIINVDLTGYDGSAISQNRNGSNDGADLILWNFFGANTLTLQNQFYGTVFAPDLAFTHQNNDLKGQVIAASFTKLGGQVHVHRYEGDVPPPPAVPETGSSLLLALGAMTALAGLRARSRRAAA